jgi:hypothetical protein
VHASHRRFAQADAAGALRLVAPALGWRRSVFDLLLTGVPDADLRATRTQRIRHLGRLADDRRFETRVPCPARPPLE